MKTFKILSVMATIGLLSACGSNSTRDNTVASSGLQGNSNSNGVAVASPTPVSLNPYNLPQAPEQLVQISGTGGPSPSAVIGNLSTSYTLKVKVTPQPAPHLTIPGYTNWVFPYGCLQLQVVVNGTTQMTQLLKVAGVPQAANSPCANAPTSQILDFSNAMTGSGAVSVTLSNANYDNCRYYNPLTYGCGTSAVWMNHMVAANVAVQVDGTYLAP